MTAQPSFRWYAFYVSKAAGFVDSRRRFGEFAAVEQMREAGVHAFAPALRIIRRPHRRAKRRIVAAAPLIPGYCFAKLPAPPTRAQMRRWHLVRGVVRRGLQPVPIPADQVEAMARLDGTCTPLGLGPLPYDSSGHLILRDGRPVRPPKPGEQVTTLAGVTGTVEAVDRERVTLLVEMLGSLRRASVGMAELAPV